LFDDPSLSAFLARTSRIEMIASLAWVHFACVASSYPMLRDNGACGSFDTLFPSLVQPLTVYRRSIISLTWFTLHV
jgi:hypothetical protein